MGTLSLAAPLVLFEKSRLWVYTGFHLLPSFHHHPTQHNKYYTNSYTYSHPNLNFLQYTIQILVSHVMWSAQVVRELKIDNTQCHLSTLHGTWSTQVQWVGIGTHTKSCNTDALPSTSCFPNISHFKLIKIYNSETLDPEFKILTGPTSCF